MCLTLRTNDSDKPYNDEKIRWKVMYAPKPEELIASRFVRSEKWTLNEWRTAEGLVSNTILESKGMRGNFHRESSAPWDHGYHVYVSRQAAEASIKPYQDYVGYKVAMMEVDGFMASGSEERDVRINPSEVETWKKAKLLELSAVFRGGEKFNTIG